MHSLFTCQQRVLRPTVVVGTAAAFTTPSCRLPSNRPGIFRLPPTPHHAPPPPRARRHLLPTCSELRPSALRGWQKHRKPVSLTAMRKPFGVSLAAVVGRHASRPRTSQLPRQPLAATVPKSSAGGVFMYIRSMRQRVYDKASGETRSERYYEVQ